MCLLYFEKGNSAAHRVRENQRIMKYKGSGTGNYCHYDSVEFNNVKKETEHRPQAKSIYIFFKIMIDLWKCFIYCVHRGLAKERAWLEKCHLDKGQILVIFMSSMQLNGIKRPMNLLRHLSGFWTTTVSQNTLYQLYPCKLSFSCAQSLGSPHTRDVTNTLSDSVPCSSWWFSGVVGSLYVGTSEK